MFGGWRASATARVSGSSAERYPCGDVKNPANHIFEHTPETLREWCSSRRMQAFRAIQILEWVYGKKTADPLAMSNLSNLDRQALSREMAFESGRGCVLTDVDGNEYIDFSSGIYVTTLGHCHPKVSEAIAKYANSLMNAHDFTTEIKTRLCEKLAEVLPGD